MAAVGPEDGLRGGLGVHSCTCTRVHPGAPSHLPFSDPSVTPTRPLLQRLGKAGAGGGHRHHHD